MKKILFNGLPAEVTEEGIRTSLEKLGPVHSVTIFRDGDPQAPAVVVEMDISDELAFNLTTRVTEFWHDGRMLNAHLLLH